MSNYTDKAVAYGIYNGTTYGPYSQAKIDEREASGTTYLDELVYVSNNVDILIDMKEYEEAYKL